MRIQYECTSEDYAQATQKAAPKPSGLFAIVLTFIGILQIYWSLTSDGGDQGNAPALDILMWIGLLVAFWLVIFLHLTRSGTKKSIARPWVLRAICAATWCAVIALWIANRSTDSLSIVISRVLVLLPWVLIGVAFGPLIALFGRRVAIRHWAGMEHQHGLLTLETTDTGFYLYAPLWSAAYRWEAIRDVQETRDVVVLKVAQLAFVMVPKRAFSSQQDYELFKRMAADKRTYPPPPLPPPVDPLPMAQLSQGEANSSATG